MRIIELTQTEAFNEREQLLVLLKPAPVEGYTFEDVEMALKVMAALRAPGSLRLENAEWSFLAGVIGKQRWAVALPEIVTLRNKIVNAPEAPAPGAGA